MNFTKLKNKPEIAREKEASIVKLRFFQVNIRSTQWRLKSNSNFFIVSATDRTQAARLIERRGFVCTGIIKMLDADSLEEAIKIVKERIEKAVATKAQEQQKTFRYDAWLVYAESKLTDTTETVAFIIHTKSQTTVKRLIASPYWKYNYSEVICIEYKVEPKPFSFRNWLGLF